MGSGCDRIEAVRDPDMDGRCEPVDFCPWCGRKLDGKGDGE